MSGGSVLFRVYMGVAAVIVLTLACSQPEPSSGSPPQVAQVPSASPTVSAEREATPTPQASGPPKVDKTIASVPLSDVVFDTFRGGFIRLSEATDSQIENLRDQIKPIYSPKYDGPEGGDWLNPRDMVIGYESESGAFAFPVKMLNLHELVNATIGGEPVLVSYCPLCASGVVYSRILNDQTLVFGNTSALYESDLVMFDHQTGSYWHQVVGEAIVGSLTGQRLRLLPSVTVPWGQWKGDHPDTRILSTDQGFFNPLRGNPYERDSFAGYQSRVNRNRFIFPVSQDKLDSRLKSGDMVIALQVGATNRAYLLTGRPDEAINDEIEGRKIVVFILGDGPAGSAFFSASGDTLLTFKIDNGIITDSETGSTWNFSGTAISGPLEGRRLEAVPSRTSFWFSLVGSLPDVELHP